MIKLLIIMAPRLQVARVIGRRPLTWLETKVSSVAASTTTLGR